MGCITRLFHIVGIFILCVLGLIPVISPLHIFILGRIGVMRRPLANQLNL